MKKYLKTAGIVLLTFLLTACGTSGNPIILPDRAEVVSIEVSDGEKSVSLFNSEEESAAFIDAFYTVLADMKTTGRKSVNDMSTNQDCYIVIHINGADQVTTLFYYKDKGTEYMEQPYQGIYKPKSSLEEIITGMFGFAEEQTPAL